VYQVGSFAQLFSSGKLRSPLISISPDTIVDARAGSITLTVPVAASADQCLIVASNMVVREFTVVCSYQIVTLRFAGLCSF
jgi:hypothetical protein